MSPEKENLWQLFEVIKVFMPTTCSFIDLRIIERNDVNTNSINISNNTLFRAGVKNNHFSADINRDAGDGGDEIDFLNQGELA